MSKQRHTEARLSREPCPSCTVADADLGTSSANDVGGRCLDVASRGQLMGQQFRMAFDEIGTSQRRNTEVRLTHRWRKVDSNPWSPLNRRRLRDHPWRLGRMRVRPE